MKKVLIEYMKKFVDLPEEELHEIAGSVPMQSFEKGTILQEQGEPVNRCYFVLKGIIRQFHFDEEGYEITSNFYMEAESVTIFSAKNGDGLSPFYLECLEDCDLIVGDLSTESSAYESNPTLREMTHMMVESDMGKLQEAYTNFISSSPEERYRALLEEKPLLIERVTQHQLASYLGITPESLSRIKKRVSSHLRLAK